MPLGKLLERDDLWENTSVNEDVLNFLKNMDWDKWQTTYRRLGEMAWRKSFQ
jgi:hypothetical protein